MDRTVWVFLGWTLVWLVLGVWALDFWLRWSFWPWQQDPREDAERYGRQLVRRLWVLVSQIDAGEQLVDPARYDEFIRTLERDGPL
ncbi:MAG TPA: hypothetical protein VG476_02685 [Acidimicrobiales bacterium]|nr:hypothetical protein [Acidimicrobiales bacterium]